jgi:hypothetical protein
MKDKNADSENRKPSKQSAIFSDDEDTEKLVKKKKKKTSLEGNIQV